MCLFCGPSRSDRLRYDRSARPASVAELLDGNADIILHGGPILTMNAGRSVATALAVRHGLVQSVGSLEEAMSRKGRLTRLLDLDGRAVLPGFVLTDLDKDAVEFLEWQFVDSLPTRLDEMDAFVARSIMPSMFGEPIYVHVAAMSERPAVHALLLALGRLCGGSPLALRWQGSTDGFANGTMLRMAPCQDVSPVADAHGFARVEDLRTMLLPVALSEQHSVNAIAGALNKQIGAASSLGFTTVVDQRMGSVAGRREIDAAARVLQKSRRIRVSAAANDRLRHEWDGTLPEGLPAGRLCVDEASVSVDGLNPGLAREVSALHDAGWRIAFDVRDGEELDTVTRICLDLAGDKVAGRHRVTLAFVPDRQQAEAIAELGLCLSIEPQRQCLDSGMADERTDPVQARSSRLVALTREAARRRGLELVAGTIDVGRRADFAVLKDLTAETLTINVDATWVDGAPV